MTVRRSFIAALAGLALAAAPAFAQAPKDDLSKVQRVTLAEFKTLHAADRVLTIDVRDPHAFDAGHVPGALNVSVVDLEIMGNRMLREKRPIVAYCACPDDHSAMVVASRLTKIGVKDIKVLTGGWNGWKAGGGKVEVTPPQ